MNGQRCQDFFRTVKYRCDVPARMNYFPPFEACMGCSHFSVMVRATEKRTWAVDTVYGFGDDLSLPFLAIRYRFTRLDLQPSVKVRKSCSTTTNVYVRHHHCQTVCAALCCSRGPILMANLDRKCVTPFA